MIYQCRLCGVQFSAKKLGRLYCSHRCANGVINKAKSEKAREKPPLTQGRLKELFVLDESTGIFYRRKDHNRCKQGGVAGHLSPIGRWVISVDGKQHYRYRLAFLYVYGWMPKEIDHRDRNPLNDRPDNLRPCTQSQNCANSKRKQKAPLFPRYVIRDKRKRKNSFIARIKVNGRQKHVGSFSTPEAAHGAAVEAVQAHFGEFACVA